MVRTNLHRRGQEPCQEKSGRAVVRRLERLFSGLFVHFRHFSVLEGSADLQGPQRRPTYFLELAREPAETSVEVVIPS